LTVADASSPAAPSRRLRPVPDQPAEPPAGSVSIGSGWRYAPGVAVWCLSGQSGDWVRKLDWCPEVRHAVRYATQDGQTITRRFEVWVGEQREVVSLSDLSRGVGVWGKFAAASVVSGKALGDALVNIVTHQASQLPDTPGYPGFRDGRLVMPPAAYLPDGYTRGEGSSRAALRDLVAALAPYPRAALVMGMSAAAPWIGGLQLQPFTCHLCGDTTCGKSTLLTAASALWGTGYKGVTKIWGGTKLGVPGQLRDLGVLPGYRDELGTAGLSPADRATMFSLIMEGAYRSARTRDDLPRPSASWASILFSTGNMSAVPESHISAGHPKGVIEMHGDDEHPFIPPAERDRVQALTNAPEMAGAWVPFALKLSLEAMRGAYEGAGADLGGPPAGGLTWHMWRAMSLSVAGARALALVTGVPELAANALAAARDVIAGADERMTEIGADQGQRLIDALTEYLSIRPAAFGLGDTAAVAHTDQVGFVKVIDGRELTCVYPTKHGEITRAAGVEDVAVAHRQLRGEGRLVVTAGQGLKYRVRPVEGAKPMRVFAYNLSDETAMNSLNTMNSAGQGPSECSDQDRAGYERGPGHYEQAPLGWPAGSAGAQANPEPRAARCEACGEPMTVICDGQRWHPTCEPESPPEAVSGPPEPVAAPAPARPESGPAETPGRQDGETSRRPVADLDPDEELAAFTRALAKHGLGAGAAEADFAAALALFSEVTGGLRWVSYAGQTGQAAFARMLAKHGSMKAPVELTDQDALRLCRDDRLTVTRYHVRTGMGRQLARTGAHVTGYDINGQYPAAAGIAELGDGQPEWVSKPRTLAGMWAKPGYVQLASPVRAARVPELKLIKGDGTAPAAGDWLPMPVVRFLGDDLGLTVDASRVAWWPRSGRRLRAFTDRVYREPRAALEDMPPSLARDLAKSALKIMVNDSIGMLRSEVWSQGRWYRPDWNDMITSLSEMNALRAIRKLAEPPIVKACDSLYFAAAPPCEACAADSRTPAERAKSEYPEGHQAKACGKPAGLILSSQLGKVKLERHADVTDAMADAYKNGSAKSFHEAVKAAVAAREGETR
jgi:hypothetical protein